MRKNVVLFLLTLVGISIIISVAILLMVGNYKLKRDKVRKEEEKAYQDFNNLYNTFQEKIQHLDKSKTLLDKKLIDYISYLEDMSSKTLETYKVLEEYDNSILDLDSSFNKIREICDIKKFSRVDERVKCNTMMLNYEIIVNGFVQKVTILNQKVDEYNTWISENNKKQKSILEYKLISHTDYVDVNNDKKYSGVEEE